MAVKEKLSKKEYTLAVIVPKILLNNRKYMSNVIQKTLFFHCLNRDLAYILHRTLFSFWYLKLMVYTDDDAEE